MGRTLRSSPITVAGLVLATLTLAGCGIREEAVVTAGTGTIPSEGNISLLMPDDTQSSRVAFHAALKRAFEDRGRSTNQDGALVADFALAQIGADEALYFSEAGADAPPPSPIVDIRKNSIFDGCKAVRTRAKLVIFQRVTGDLIASGEAEAIGCEDDEAPNAELAAMLVDQVSD